MLRLQSFNIFPYFRTVVGKPLSCLRTALGGPAGAVVIQFFLYMTHTALPAQHNYPESIQEEVRVALSHYPQLRDVPITFKFKRNIRKSVMLAQPDFLSFFRNRRKRRYKILINQEIRISEKSFRTMDIPKDVLIGWLGHELGHIMDYKDRGSFNLLWFGMRYKFSGSYLKIAERTADAFAVTQGMEEYILRTKDFILNNADIGESYKERIRKFYLSPKEILLLVEEREAEKETHGI
jgi:hypothetical protein